MEKIGGITTMEFQDLLLKGGQRVADVLLGINRQQSIRFVNAKLSRQAYRSRHPTEIVWLKCMDGRLNGPVFTETPLGIISPFRAAGARFDLGWPYFMDKVAEIISYAITHGRHCLFFCTYHYSKGSHERGCAAFGLDTEAAKSSTLRVKRQFDQAFAGPDRVIHAVMVGLETDEDALVLHGTEGSGTVLNLADLPAGTTQEELRSHITDLYPDLPVRVVSDLLPLLMGNLRHIAAIRQSKREPEELDHRELGLFLGRGFPWLHTPNRAIIIGPWEEWKTELVLGSKLILKNLRTGRIPETTRPVFMVSAPYRELGTPEHHLAPFKARYLHMEGLGVLRKEVPELMAHLDFLVGTVNMENLLFEQIAL